MEEPLGCAADAGWQAPRTPVWTHAERVYAVAEPDARDAEVYAVLRRVIPYPGVGVLGSLARPLKEPNCLAAADLDEVVESAVAAVVSAWDAEAHVLAPRGGAG
jgi:hypothetical protein